MIGLEFNQSFFSFSFRNLINLLNEREKGVYMKIERTRIYWNTAKVLLEAGIITSKIGMRICGDKSSSECKIGDGVWRTGAKMMLKSNTMMLRYLEATI